MNIVFDTIAVNSVFKNSGVFVGENTQCYWRSTAKENSGGGTVVGSHNVMAYNYNLVVDNDVVDTPIWNGSSSSGEGSSKSPYSE
ncbi:hypothetical protein [Pontibacillus halophilus]|nr:hypothetical protein [Pontibacillus halophilus]